MGNCCPKEKKLGEVKEEETFLQSLQRRNIVQFQHKSSGSYVVPELNGEMTYLIYMDKLSNVQVYSSYFEILASGVIKHFDSDCIVASEGPSIQAGFGLALKEQLEKQDSDYSFKFTEKGLLMHQQTKLIVMPETNAIYNGSKLVVHPFSKDVDNGTIANHFEVVKVKIEVIMNEIEKKKERDIEITFQNSSDGKAAAREKLLMLQETQAPLQANTIANADFAKIQIGTNRLHISTIKNPVSNLSMNSNGMMSLTDLDLDRTETWQILPADPNKLPCADPDEIYGNDVSFFLIFFNCFYHLIILRY